MMYLVSSWNTKGQGLLEFHSISLNKHVILLKQRYSFVQSVNLLNS